MFLFFNFLFVKDNFYSYYTVSKLDGARVKGNKSVLDIFRLLRHLVEKQILRSFH